MKVQVGSSVVSLDVDALILAVIRRCIAILEVIGLKGDLSSVELAALCKFLFAVADIARLEKESKSAFLSAGEAAYLRMCHELLNKTSFRQWWRNPQTDFGVHHLLDRPPKHHWDYQEHVLRREHWGTESKHGSRQGPRHSWGTLLRALLRAHCERRGH